MEKELFLGLDLGTSGLRAIVADETGAVVSSVSAPLVRDRKDAANGLHEQDAEEWLEVARKVLGEAAAQSRRTRPDSRIAAISVDGTSGTVVAVDEALRPVSPAIMYDDTRCSAVAKEISPRLAPIEEKMGYRFSCSFGAPKVAWLMRQPQGSSARWFLSAADFLASHITAAGASTDTSNALKMGFDLLDMRWPAQLKTAGIPIEKLPPVLRSGSLIAPVAPAFARSCSLDENVAVVAGLTDGTAGLLATGASAVGQMASTVGTTLVVKLVWNRILKDPEGRIYCHYHPDDHWLPGGACNAGALALEDRFGRERLAALESAAPRDPTSILIYPLTGTGERFPFLAPNAQRFVVGNAANDAELYRAFLEGIAFVEKLSVELLESMGAKVGSPVWSAGSAGQVRLLGRIRASVLRRPIAISRNSQSAFGSAILAASAVNFKSVEKASSKMAFPEAILEPEKEWAEFYEKTYRQWKNELYKRGWLL